MGLARPATMRSMLRVATFIGTFALVLTATGATSPARAADPPLCIYDGNSFSEGAHICGQASLVMTCAVTGDRAVWKVVTDRDISRLCTTSSRSEAGTRPRAHRHAARRFSSNSVSPPIGFPPTDQAKCFTFNGKRYCE